MVPDSSSKVTDSFTKINDSLWELYAPAPGLVTMDIVFFHGLQLDDFKNAFWKTWLVRGSMDEIWPRKWLSLKFPRARMLSVSYNSSVGRVQGPLRVDSLAENLLADVILGEAAVGQHRPVILVGHSWGGLVIKQLITAALRRILRRQNLASPKYIERITEFLGNIRGVFYYATPHHDSRLADLGRRLLPKASPILELLNTLNVETASINFDFKQCQIPAAALGEGLDTCYGTFFPFKGRVVEEASARLEIDDFHTIRSANHFDVCKAESADSSVIRKLDFFLVSCLSLGEGITPMGRTRSSQRAGTGNESEDELLDKRESMWNTVTTNEEYFPPGVTRLNRSVYQFCAPRFGAPEIRIIFFHGLQAGNYRIAYRDAHWKGWMSNDGKTLWPQTLLGEKFPTAQILSVSYNYAARKARTRRLVDYLDSIVEKLVEDIIMDESFRDYCPILLVGHSLGGLVLKKLVRSAYQIGGHDSRIKKFLANVRGSFYYSTPHNGTRLADIVSKIPVRDEVLAFLKTLSNESSWLNIEFAHWRMNEGVKATSLGEALPTDPKIWGVMTTKPIVIVEADSCRYDTDVLYTVPDANHITICQPNDMMKISFRVLEQFVKECLEARPVKMIKLKLDENDIMISTTPVLEAVTEAFSPGAVSYLRRVPDKVKDNLSFKDRAKAMEHQEASEIEPGSQTKRASGPIFCLEDFRTEVEKGGKDGYFVSSKWLFNLEEIERENFMSILRKAGYFETRQTCTTISFARIGNDRQNHIPSDGESRSSTKVDDIGAPKGGNDVQVGIGRQGFNIVKSADIPEDVCGSENLAETSSSIDRGSRTFEDEKLEEMSLAVGEQRAMWSKSFQEALERKGHRTFCVSTEWLSNLKDHERKALEAGYEKIRQTKTVTWYEKIAGYKKNPPGEDIRDNDSSKSSNSNHGTRGALKVLATSASSWLSARLFGGRQNLKDEDKTSTSSSVENTTDTRRIEDEFSTCHRRLFSVRCSSPSQTMNLPAIFRHTRVQRFGEAVVTMPIIDQSQNCSTRMEKPFVLMAPYFAGGRFREVSVNLKALASMTLSGCVTFDPYHTKVRLKFSVLSGQVENVEESEEELLHEIVLGSLYTTVYGCTQSPTNRNDWLGDIILNLEDEYHPPRRRVLATARQSEDDSTDSVDLSWLEISPSPGNCEPGSTTVVLRGDIKGRRDNESKRQVQPADSLHFQRPPPVILEGDVLYPDSFLEFRIRHQLTVSYISLCREEGELCREVCPYREITKTIDFDCCLIMSTDCLREPT